MCCFGFQVKRMVESVERAAAAANHAVKISTQARNAFEEEHIRLSAMSVELAMLANRGNVI